MFGDGGIGPRDDHAIVAVLRPAGPEFLTGQRPAVAIGHCLGAKAREVRSAGGFGEQLAPDFLALERRQHALLYPVLVLAEAHEDRHRHPQRDAEIAAGHAERHFLGIEGYLFEVAETLAAEFDRPVDPGKASVKARGHVSPTKRKVFLDRQAAARVAAELRRDRSQPSARGIAICVKIGHCAASRACSSRSKCAVSSETSRSSHHIRLPCSIARLRARRMCR